MHVEFTDKEKEWLVMEPFNWHVSDGTPKKLRESIEHKLKAIDGQSSLSSIGVRHG